MLALVLALAAVVGTSGLVAWALTRPVELTVADGSVSGLIQGNFAHTTDSLHPLIRSFNATTFANETGHPTQGPATILSLQLTAYTFSDGYRLMVDLNFTIRGTFPSNLRLHDLQIGVNETGVGIDLAILNYGAHGTNVSYNFSQISPGLNPPMSLALVNQQADGVPYEFAFTGIATVGLMDLRIDNFFGFRATVDGQIAPAVGVGVTLETINTP